MNIQEYQSKDLFKAYNIPVLNSQVVNTAEQAGQAVKSLGGSVWVVKAQILAGGRGKAGGVQLAKTPEDVTRHASALLGKYLKTHQTSDEGEKVNELLIECGCSIKKEYYLSLLIDPQTNEPVFIASPEGGMDIEEVNARTPEKILKQRISISAGVSKEDAHTIGKFLGLSSEQELSQVEDLCVKLYKLFTEKEATLLEINPLVKDDQDRLIALDGKMSFDENALFRHEDLQTIHKNQIRKDSETEALKYGLSFIELNGTIGCMVNGAGLAMATMDIIKLYGAEPANFLDVGGGATEDKVAKAFEIILQSENVKAILVNIFGGIMKCDVLASGLVKAAKSVGLTIPTVVRLEGTRAKEGLAILKESGLSLIAVDDLDEAARKVVEVSK